MTLLLLAVAAAAAVLAARRRRRPPAHDPAELRALGTAIARDVEAGHTDPLLPHPEVRAMCAAIEARTLRQARPWLTVWAWLGGRIQLEEERSNGAALLMAEAEIKAEGGGPRNWRSSVRARGGRAALIALATALGAVLAEPALSTLGFSDQALPIVSVLVAAVFATLFAVAFRTNGAIRADLGRPDLGEAERMLLQRRRRWVFVVVAVAVPALAATAVCREHNTRVKEAQQATPIVNLCAIGGASATAPLGSGPKVARTPAPALADGCSDGNQKAGTPWSWWMAILELPVLVALALTESLSGATLAARAAERRRRRLVRQEHRRLRRLSLRLLLTDFAYRQLDLLMGRSRRELAQDLEYVDAAYRRARTTVPEGQLAWPDELVADPYGELLLGRLTSPPETTMGLRVVRHERLALETRSRPARAEGSKAKVVWGAGAVAARDERPLAVVGDPGVDPLSAKVANQEAS